MRWPGTLDGARQVLAKIPKTLGGKAGEVFYTSGDRDDPARDAGVSYGSLGSVTVSEEYTTDDTASGKPAVVQDTGFSDDLPCGEGLLAFTTVDEAVAAIEAVERDYPRHCRAARRIAEEHLDVCVEVRQPELDGSAVVDAGHEARGDVEGAAERDHEVREVAADTDLFDDGVQRGRHARRAAGHEHSARSHPIANRLHTPVALPQMAELARRQPI